MDGSTIGVGIIGLSARGGWAAEAHVRAINATEGVTLRALAASSADAAVAAASRFGIAAYDDPASLAHDPLVDLVVVAVKVSAHRGLVEAALGAGKPILCEWPLGKNTGEAQLLAEAVRAHDLRSFVGLQARAAPVIRLTHELVQDGYVGDVLSSTVVADCLSWGGTTLPGKTYLLDRDEGASMLTIPVGHTLDAVEMVLGDLHQVRATTAIRRPMVVMHGEPSDIHAKTVADQVALHARTDAGAIFSAHFRGGISRTTSFRWEINGTDGDLLLHGQAGAFLEYGDVELMGGRQSDRGLKPLPTPESHNGVIAHNGVIGLNARGDHAFTLAHAYARIADDLQSGTHEAVDFDHALRLHELLDAIDESARDGIATDRRSSQQPRPERSSDRRQPSTDHPS